MCTSTEKCKHIQGVPRKMTAAKRHESRLWHWIYLSTFFNIYDFWNKNLKTLLVLAFSKCLFCAVNITGDVKNFVQISIFLNKTKIVEIWTKIFKSLVIMKAQKSQITLITDILWWLTENFSFKISFTNKRRKLFSRSKTTFKLSCYCHVPWNTLYMITNYKTFLNNLYTDLYTES